jgi:hypothetical protein
MMSLYGAARAYPGAISIEGHGGVILSSKKDLGAFLSSGQVLRSDA